MMFKGMRPPRLFRQSSLQIGIHLTNTAVCALVLDNEQGYPCVLDYCLVGRDSEQSAIAQLARFFDKYQQDKPSVNVCILPEVVASKEIRLPILANEDEILAHIFLDAEQYIDIPLHEAAFDFLVLPSQTDDNDQHLNIKLFTAYQSAVDQAVAFCASLGFEPMTVEPQIQSLQRALASMLEPQKHFLVVDIDEMQSLIYFAHQHHLNHIQTCPMGAGAMSLLNHQTDDLDKADEQVGHKLLIEQSWQEPSPPSFGITRIEFGEQYDDVQAPFTHQSPLVQNFNGQTDEAVLAQQLTQTIKRLQINQADVAGVILTGLNGNLPNLALILTQMLDMPVEWATSKIQTAKATDGMMPALMVAYGLALKSDDTAINFLPWRENRRYRQQRQFVRLLWSVAIFSLLLVLAGWAFLWLQIGHQQSINDAIKHQIDEQAQKISQIEQIKSSLGQIDEQLGAVNALQDANITLLDEWQELPTLLGDGVYLVSIDGAKTVQIAGVAKQLTLVADFARNLENTGRYQSVMITQVANNEQGLVDFAISVDRANADGAKLDDSK